MDPASPAISPHVAHLPVIVAGVTQWDQRPYGCCVTRIASFNLFVLATLPLPTSLSQGTPRTCAVSFLPTRGVAVAIATSGWDVLSFEQRVAAQSFASSLYRDTTFSASTVNRNTRDFGRLASRPPEWAALEHRHSERIHQRHDLTASEAQHHYRSHASRIA